GGRSARRRRRHRQLVGLYGGDEGVWLPARGRAASTNRHRDHAERARRRAAAHRRAVHGDQRAFAWVLPGGRPGPGHRARLGGQDANRPLRSRGGQAGDRRRCVAETPGVDATDAAGAVDAGGAAAAGGPGRADAVGALERAYRDEWTAIVATLA